MPHHRRFFMALTALLAFATLLSIARADTGNTVYLPLLVSDGSGQGQAPVPTDLTATATSTATATATTTPTEPCTGVYPIGIDTATITGDTFNNLGVDTTNPNEYKVLSNGQIQRRLYVTTDSMPGGFAYLRWNESFAPGGIPATSGQALVNSLSGEGNYGSGFEEAPWPVLGTAPVDYPNQPGALNAGDWIWGTPGWKDSTGATGVPAALDAQIVTGRPMILPIYSNILSSGSEITVRTSRLGLFMLTGQGKDPAYGLYLDLIFLGDAGSSNLCPATQPQPVELFGGVSFYPEYAILSDSGCTPGASASGWPTSGIDPSEFVNGTGGLMYPQVGEVTVTSATDAFTAPIIASSDGSLSYYFTPVPVGTYTLQAYIYHHHPLDQPGVMRMYTGIWDGSQVMADLPVTITPGLRAEQAITLKLIGDVCAMP